MNRDSRFYKRFERTRKALVVGAVLLLGTTSCATETSQKFQLTATIDGVAFSGGIVQATRDGLLLDVSALVGTRLLLLHVNLPATPGTVSIGTGNTSDYGQVQDGSGTFTTSTGGTGSIVVTKITDAETTGTFAFTAELSAGAAGTPSKTVTNGAFRVSF